MLSRKLQRRLTSEKEKAATKELPIEPPSAANNYRTHTYDFAYPMKQPDNRLAEADNRCPYWCEHHDACMHMTKDGVGAQVSLAVSRWRVLSQTGLTSLALACQLALRSKQSTQSSNRTIGHVSMARMTISKWEVTGISISDIETPTKACSSHPHLIVVFQILAYLANSACSSLRDRLA